MQDNISAAQADMKARLRALLDRYGKTVYDSAYQKTGDAALARTVTVRVFKEMYRTMYAQTDAASMDAWVQGITARELADIEFSEVIVSRQAAAPEPPAREEIAAEIAVCQTEAVPERETRGYGRAAHERAVEPKKRGRGMDWFWGILLFIGTAVLLWAIAGLLMAQGILPQLDLGYSALGIF